MARTTVVQKIRYIGESNDQVKKGEEVSAWLDLRDGFYAVVQDIGTTSPKGKKRGFGLVSYYPTKEDMLKNWDVQHILEKMEE